MERYYLMVEKVGRKDFDRMASVMLNEAEGDERFDFLTLDWMLENFDYGHSSTIVVGVF